MWLDSFPTSGHGPFGLTGACPDGAPLVHRPGMAAQSLGMGLACFPHSPGALTFSTVFF